MTNEKSRNLEFDLLRVISAIAVIITHTCSYTANTNEFNTIEWILSTFIAQVNMFAVPTFFMISGYFLLRSDDFVYHNFMNKTFKKIVIPFLLWSCVYVIYELKLWQFLYVDFDVNMWQTIIIKIFQGPPHLWFIFYVLSYYLFLPFLKAIVKDKSLSRYYFIIIFVFKFILPYLGLIPFLKPLAELGETFGINRFFGFSIYFILGYKLSNHEFKISLARLSVIFLISILFIPILTILLSLFLKTKYLYFENYLSPSIFVAVSCLFYIFDNLKINRFTSLRKIAGMQKYTFSTYLSHILIINIIIVLGSYSFISNKLIALCVNIVLTVILTFLFSCIFSNTKNFITIKILRRKSI